MPGAEEAVAISVLCAGGGECEGEHEDGCEDRLEPGHGGSGFPSCLRVKRARLGRYPDSAGRLPDCVGRLRDFLEDRRIERVFSTLGNKTAARMGYPMRGGIRIWARIR